MKSKHSNLKVTYLILVGHMLPNIVLLWNVYMIHKTDAALGISADPGHNTRNPDMNPIITASHTWRFGPALMTKDLSIWGI